MTKLVILLLTVLLLFNCGECLNRVTYYASVGDTVRLQCSGGTYFCFSTYTFQNLTHPMVMLNSSLKYSVQMGSLTINNLQQTDAGYYACSSNCTLMRSDLINFYVHPLGNFCCAVLNNSLG